MSNQLKYACRGIVVIGITALLGTPGLVCGQPIRIELISSIRRIEVQKDFSPTPSPSSPFVVRALSEPAGVPISGQRLFLGPGSDFAYPHLFDEFGFRGFNTVGQVSYNSMGGSSLQYFGVTGSDGVAAFSGQYLDPAPSAFVVAVGPDAQPMVPSSWRFISVVAVKNVPAGKPSVVVEYFNPSNGHYFITISQNEIDALEAGKFAGWQRSTGAFIAYETEADAPPWRCACLPVLQCEIHFAFLYCRCIRM